MKQKKKKTVRFQSRFEWICTFSVVWTSDGIYADTPVTESSVLHGRVVRSRRVRWRVMAFGGDQIRAEFLRVNVRVLSVVRRRWSLAGWRRRRRRHGTLTRSHVTLVVIVGNRNGGWAGRRIVSRITSGLVAAWNVTLTLAVVGVVDVVSPIILTLHRRSMNGSVGWILGRVTWWDGNCTGTVWRFRLLGLVRDWWSHAVSCFLTVHAHFASVETLAAARGIHISTRSINGFHGVRFNSLAALVTVV